MQTAQCIEGQKCCPPGTGTAQFSDGLFSIAPFLNHDVLQAGTECNLNSCL
jgi:hypothetical protein